MKAISLLTFLIAVGLGVALALTKNMSAPDVPFEAFRRTIAPSYTPLELWDAALGSPKQRGRAFSQSGPSTWSYVRVKGILTRIQHPRESVSSESPSFIFAVDRSSDWNGITMHGFISAALESKRQEDYEQFSPGRKIEVSCQIGAGAMPFIYLVSCKTGKLW